MTYMFKNLNATISKPKEMLDSIKNWIAYFFKNEINPSKYVF